MSKRDKKLAKKFRGKPCCICGAPGNGHHIISFGSRPSLDVENNIISLCSWHHSLVHQKGLTKFAEKYGLKEMLEFRGYYFDDKWRYPSKEL